MDLASINFEVPILFAPIVVLIGPPGVGKTAVGGLLAKSLNYQFLDTDSVIEEKSGKPVAQIFESYGESGFRTMELGLLQKLCQAKLQTLNTGKEPAGTVIATGAGMPIAPGNFELLHSLGQLVYLFATIETLLARLGNCKSRPLFNFPDQDAHRRNEVYKQLEIKLQLILKERKAIYEKARFSIDSSKLLEAEVMQKIIELLGLPS